MGHGHSANNKCSKITRKFQQTHSTDTLETCTFVKATSEALTMNTSNHLMANSDELSDDDVFSKDDTMPRYHNFPSTEKPNKLKSSSIRDRISSIESDNFKYLPQWDSDDHSLRHASFPRKRCSKCIIGTLRTSHMQDIIIISLKGSDDSSFWVKLLSNYFKEITIQASKKPLNIRSVGLEDFLGKSEEECEKISRKISSYKLQLLVVCRDFLDFMSKHHEECSHLTETLLDDRTLALLVDVTELDLNEVHRKILPTFAQWPKHIIGPNLEENFAKVFLEQALAILLRVWNEQQQHYLTYAATTSREKHCFSITPKKIRQGQTSVFVFLTYPLQKEDIVKVSICKHGELFEMSSIKRRNPYIIKFTVPENMTNATTMLQVLVEKNGSIIGSKPLKCETKFKEMEEILKTINDPVNFLCQTLKYTADSDNHQLDQWFVKGFQKNKPAYFDLITKHSTPPPNSQIHDDRSQETYPTLLHFAARFGLGQLCRELLVYPSAAAACRLRNADNMIPAKMAEHYGHVHLAATLEQQYMNQAAATTEQELIPAAVTPDSLDEVDGYLVPKMYQEYYYKACPMPRPVDMHQLTPSSECSYNFNDNFSHLCLDNQYEDIDADIDTVEGKPDSPIIEDCDDNIVQITSQCNLEEMIEEKVQKELIQIIRNNAPTEADAEKLLEYWRTHSNHHLDGCSNTTGTKKLKPFERIRNIFWKQNKVEKPEPSTSSSSRPQSSLSGGGGGVSSPTSDRSGSSIRYSFVVTDDGTSTTTLSDTEEMTKKRRRGFFRSQSEDYTTASKPQFVVDNNVTTDYSVLVTRAGSSKTLKVKKDKSVKRPRNLSLREEFFRFPVQVEEKSENNVTATSIMSSGNHDYVNCNIVSK